MQISFKVITPERVVYEDLVDAVTLPAEEGEITVLPQHIPLISLLRSGVITLKKDGQEIHMASSGGFVEVLTDSRVVVLADTAERAEELTLEAVEAAKQKAEEAIRNLREAGDVAEAAALTHLERELARLKAIKRRDSHGHKSPLHLS